MIGCWCLVVGVWLFCCLVVLLFGCLVVLLSVWKTVPSKARVTRDEVSGLLRRRELSGRQYPIVVLLRLRLSPHALKRCTDKADATD